MSYKMSQMSYMTWKEYEKALNDGAIVFLPIGATEQHGPHLPMATDAIFANIMADGVAEKLTEFTNTIVMPALSYGYKSQARSGGGQTFPGTTSLDGQTLTHQVLDIIRELARHGADKLVIMDGHYENQWFITEAIELALREFAYTKASTSTSMKIVRCEYWDYCPQHVLDTVFDGDFPGYDLEHAALIETSMMMAVRPELVRKELIPEDATAEFAPHDHFPQDGRGVPSSGVLAPAQAATPEKGQLIIDACIANMSAAFKKEFRGTSDYDSIV